jgi:hypothetical protein
LLTLLFSLRAAGQAIQHWAPRICWRVSHALPHCSG